MLVVCIIYHGRLYKHVMKIESTTVDLFGNKLIRLFLIAYSIFMPLKLDMLHRKGIKRFYVISPTARNEFLYNESPIKMQRNRKNILND